MQSKAVSLSIKTGVFTMLVLVILFPEAAMAASGGDDGTAVFGEMYTVLKGWVEGILGKMIALACFLVGMAMGVVKQSIMATVIGIAMAIALFYGPGVIESVFGATLLLS